MVTIGINEQLLDRFDIPFSGMSYLYVEHFWFLCHW
jgi:hypothetical protein